MSASPVAVGQPAPDFRLPANRFTEDTPDGGPYTFEERSLSDYRGQPVMVVFMPLAFSPTCEGEFCVLRDDASTYADAGVQVLGVTCDSRWVLKAWAEQRRFGFPLLSDFHPKGEVARAYGVYDERAGLAQRATFAVDADGVIRDVVVSDRPRTPRDPAAYKRALARVTAERETTTGG